MTTYTVYQINLRPHIDLINSKGWEQAIAESPVVAAHCAVAHRFGDDELDFDPEYLKAYDKVALIEANCLDNVFHVGNVGPESQITRLAKMHSVSVGDIIKNPVKKTLHVVAGMGFTDISQYYDLIS